MSRAAVPHVGAIVLCGGESARMGRPKAWLNLGGEPLLARVVRVTAAVCSPVVVVAAPGQDLPALPGEIEIARDAVAGRGPLQGLAAGLAALEGRCDAVFVTACDVPWLRPAFVRRIIELLGDHEAAMPVIDGQPYPLSAVYHLTLRPLVEALLAEGRRSPKLLLERARCRTVERRELVEVDAELHSLRDVSTPQDYERARSG